MAFTIYNQFAPEAAPVATLRDASRPFVIIRSDGRIISRHPSKDAARAKVRRLERNA